jgi:hypothetical protein
MTESTTAEPDDNKKQETTFDFITRRAAELSDDDRPGDIIIGDGSRLKKHYVTKAELVKQKKEWEDSCKVMREEAKRQDPIIKYCNDIRGIKPYYELSFEEMQELETKHKEEEKRLYDEQIEQCRRERRLSSVKTSTKEERKRYRVDKKQQEKDRELEEQATPFVLLSKRLEQIGCECEGERIRVAGEYCGTCRLLVKVNAYMMGEFKNTARGWHS